MYFNPRSLAGATLNLNSPFSTLVISIHAPSRERRLAALFLLRAQQVFQSTLPRGSDAPARRTVWHRSYFNPRSLAGATIKPKWICRRTDISIHAPLRERHALSAGRALRCDFNPRSLAGATLQHAGRSGTVLISIHAPLRERRLSRSGYVDAQIFQSTLPCGSDTHCQRVEHFVVISIHAPLRERRITSSFFSTYSPFQSTLPCGSDAAPLFI